MQFFKGDATEQKYAAIGDAVLDPASDAKFDFYDGAYACFVLGELLYDTSRAPLANAIDRGIFREVFTELFAAFRVAGTFESYLTVFRNIFGDSVVVTLTVPGPGKLNIDIEAEELDESDLLARYIVASTYFFDEIVDYDGDNIAVQTVKGFQTQYELETMLFEMVPGGIYTVITLTIG